MDPEVLELGGNINLSGFKEVEPGQMVVIKKIVGNYIKKISDENSDFEKVLISLKEAKKGEFKLEGLLTVAGKNYSAEVSKNNLFFALNELLGEVSGKIK